MSLNTKLPDDDLTHFLRWYMKSAGPLAFVPLHNTVHDVDGVRSVTMFRDPPFQVQMFIAPPYKIIPEHTHPNVDSYEVYVGGQIRFSKHGKWCATEDEANAVDTQDLCGLRGTAIRVYPSDPHGGAAGPSGSCFLSVQKWLNGVEPTCVANDYTGVVMGPDHLAKVTTGSPELKTELTPTDAATLEPPVINWK
jgi:hypothetical protein